MNEFGLVKNFTADDAVAKRRIVAFGSAGGMVALATSGAALIGVSGIAGAAAGGRLDVYLNNVRPVEYGGTIAAGDYVTADAQGRAIKAEPADGIQMEVVGRAIEAGPVDAIGDILIQPQQITG